MHAAEHGGIRTLKQAGLTESKFNPMYVISTVGKSRKEEKLPPFLSYTFVKATSMAVSSSAMDSGVSSPMLEIRNVVPLIFP